MFRQQTLQHLFQSASIDSKFLAVSIIIVAIKVRDVGTCHLVFRLFNDDCQMIDHLSNKGCKASVSTE